MVAVLFLLPQAAHAYVDPGSGFMLWQGFIAAVGVALVYFRKPLEAIKRFIARLRGK